MTRKIKVGVVDETLVVTIMPPLPTRHHLDLHEVLNAWLPLETPLTRSVIQATESQVRAFVADLEARDAL